MSGLYVCRKLVNGNELEAWASSIGLKQIVDPEEFHVTVLYSRNKIYPTQKLTGLKVTGGERKLSFFDSKIFGGYAFVLEFESEQLKARNAEFLAMGGTSDYPDYKSHITIAYVPEKFSLSGIIPYSGELIFGAEVFDDIKENGSLVIKSKSL